MQIYDTVIIGGGPAGYTAALYASRAGLNTLVIEKMTAGGQMALTDIVENYPGFDGGIAGFELGMKMQSGAEKYGAKTEYVEVVSLELSDKIKRIKTTGGELFSKTVIIASGANPRRLGIEGEDFLLGRGVHYCAHCDGRFYRGKKVMVIGGGNSAVSDALYLTRLAEQVILVHRRDELRAEKIYRRPLEDAKNLEIAYNSVLSELVYSDKLSAAKIKNLKNEQISEHEIDAVFISIGRAPATELLGDNLALDKAGYIIADETTKTSVDGVFAAGDVRAKPLRQIVTAAADGAVAAHFAEEYIDRTPWEEI